MRESFILKGFFTDFEGEMPDYMTKVGHKEHEIARREFEEFPSDEDVEQFIDEFNPITCEIVKCYR